MQYLDASEYLSFGLSEETSDSLITAASALIDGFCRRPSLGITQYTERLRTGRRRSVQLSNTPLVSAAAGSSPLVAVRGRMRQDHGEMIAPLGFEAGVFFPGEQWASVDMTTIDIAADGVLTFPPNLFGMRYFEVEITYTAGFADIPSPVKAACAQIVRNAQSMPALTVKRQAIDSMQMEYFSGSLLDADVQRLLQPYIAQRIG